MGHNKVSCKNPSDKPTLKPKKKIGRPRLNPELTNYTRLGRGGGRGGRGGGRGGRRGGRSGGRGSTNVYEECESSMKKEPGIETQFVTQTTPNVESQFVTQTAPTVASEHVPETQEANVKIDDEGDGLDMADLDQILHDLSYIRESKYSEVEILLCLNITQSQLKGFDALLHQSKQAAKAYFKTRRRDLSSYMGYLGKYVRKPFLVNLVICPFFCKQYTIWLHC
uniref:Uncharacterized protein n=1 Tax=Lactuca sativa TaxID=4236 RepID=A0A9R1VBR8_LACSA|nr:hypothetical protein LSAT_V11C600321540 [Lactuca sativa]